MTLEESFEDIVFHIDCKLMCKELAKKYKGSPIGFKAKESIELLDKRIKELIHRHYSHFEERISRKEIEKLLC
jgi:hypothetical protein